MTTATKRKQTNGSSKPNGASKAKPLPRSDARSAAAPKSASDSPQSTPIELDVAHERKPLGSVWREPRSNIRRSLTNPRTVFVLDDLIETMEVRHEDGTRTKRQLSPILVRFRPDTDTGTDYEIIDGERRDRSAEVLGWDDVEVKLVEMTDDEVEEAQLVANLARADLTPLDEAHAFERLERKGYSIDQIADRVGKTRGHIRMRLALARLTDEAKAALRDNAISVGAAQELASITDATEQRRVIARALEGRAPGADPMSAKQIRMFVEQSLLVLSRAKFALDDATLRPEAGACVTCPKRSSQQFALIALANGGDDERCTDRSCFNAKQEAHWSREAERARVAGQTVIEGDAARKVLAFGGVAKDSGYVDLDAHCAELRDGRTWREVVGGDALPVSLVRSPEGTAHRVVPKADAVALLRERGLLRAPGAAAQASAVQSANDAAPETEPTSVAPEPTLLTVDQIARAAKKAKLTADTFDAIAEALIVAIDPREKEAQAIAKPYDAPVPPDADGHDAVLQIWRGLKTDGDRIALLARVACAVSQKARERLSVRLADAAPAKKRGRAAPVQSAVEPAVVTEPTDPDATADREPEGFAASEVDVSIRDNVRDLLRTHALQRSELASQLADLEGLTESDADREVEQLLREGFLSDDGERVEWVADRAMRAPEQAPLFADDAPRAAAETRAVL
jgi:ParB/RepB/Spo0J family partition protein